jgi:Zn-dependent protease
MIPPIQIGFQLFTVTDPVLIVFVLIALVLAFTVHEYAHAWMCFELGDPTAKYEGRLTLNPLVHVEWLIVGLIVLTFIMIGVPFGWGKPVQYDSDNFRRPFRDGALVAFAGPLANFVFVAVLLVPLLLMPDVPYLRLFLGVLCGVNLSLGMFNLIPCPPLDGWKILQAFVPRSTARDMQRMEVKAGMTALLVLIIVFLVAPWLNPVNYVYSWFWMNVVAARA